MKEPPIVKPFSIGQENITRDEIATVYASQKISGLRSRRLELVKKQRELTEIALKTVRVVTEDFLEEDLRYKSLMTLDALLSEDVVVKYTYNITTHDNTTWTIADNMAIQRGTFNGEFAKFAVNVLLSRKGSENAILLFTTENKISFESIEEVSTLGQTGEDIEAIDADLRIDWKAKYLETLIASILNTNLMAIGDVTLPDIKLLNS